MTRGAQPEVDRDSGATSMRHIADATAPDPRSDQSRFERLYQENWRAILAYASRRLSSVDDAEDAVAETFVVAWRRRDLVPAAPDARIWLYGVCHRVVANMLRSRNRRQRLVDRLRVPTRPDALSTEWSGDVAEALATLSQADQEILRLVAWEGLTYDEVAKTLAISANAVGIRIFRARGKLAKALSLDRPARNDPAHPGHRGS
jgi:RNA polymerase sigma factor (sigma-70 family)